MVTRFDARLGGLVLAILAVSGCAAPASRSAQGPPPPPQFFFNRSFTATPSDMQATVDREVYPPHYAGLYHTHPGYGLFCTLQGTLTIQIEGRPDVTLPSGQCWEEPPGVAHRPANLTDQQAVAVFYLIAPAGRPRIQAAATPTPRGSASLSHQPTD